MSSVFAVLILVVLIVPCAYADTETIRTEEITLSYNTEKCELRYWHNTADIRHNLEFIDIQELNDFHLRSDLKLDKAQVDTIRVTEGSQSLDYFFDVYTADRRANVYVSIEITFNEIYIHFFVGTWTLMQENNELRLRYTLDGVSHTAFLVDNSYSMNIIVSETETSQSASQSLMSNLWSFIRRNQVYLVIALLVSILLIFVFIRRNVCGCVYYEYES
jgi:hypothetical protein